MDLIGESVCVCEVLSDHATDPASGAGALQSRERPMFLRLLVRMSAQMSITHTIFQGLRGVARPTNRMCISALVPHYICTSRNEFASPHRILHPSGSRAIHGVLRRSSLAPATSGVSVSAVRRSPGGQ